MRHQLTFREHFLLFGSVTVWLPRLLEGANAHGVRFHPLTGRSELSMAVVKDDKPIDPYYERQMLEAATDYRGRKVIR